MRSLIGVQGIASTSQAFRAALLRTAEAIGANPDHLAAVISFESGFNPKAENLAGSSGVGLIQFTEPARTTLGVTREAILGMSDVEQLDLVRRYFARIGKPLPTLDDVYLAVFRPADIGKPPETVILRAGTRAYDQNAGLDRSKKGFITVGDAAAAVRAVHDAGLSSLRVPVEGESVIPERSRTGGGVVLLLALTGLWLARRRG